MTDTKKAVLAIYEILKKYSSEKNRLSKKEIEGYLKNEYNLSSNRNTIKDTLDKLEEFYGEKVIRHNNTEQKKKESNYTYAYYFDREQSEDTLSDEEILQLIDLCLYARNLTAEQAKKLMKDLKKMATLEQRKKINYIDSIPYKQFSIDDNTSSNLKFLRTRIQQNTQSEKQHWVTFNFNYYNEKKQLEPLKNKYTVLPLVICEINHKYYLICFMENRNNNAKAYHYRIDLMTNLHDVDEEKNYKIKDFHENKNRLELHNITRCANIN